MIIKERSIPLVVLILEALSRRLPQNHPKYQQIVEELGRRQAGYQGELSLDYYFRHLPNEQYMILHDLNLPDGEYNCQNDTLLLTSEFALIIEVKHMAGKLLFDTENEQFTQIHNEKEKGYPYPIAQAERHRDYLKKLMVAHKFPPIPIDYLIVLSNNYSTYTISGKNASQVRPRICKADVLLKKLSFFEKQYTNPLLQMKDLRKLCRLLVKMNTIPTNYILKKYEIKKSDINPGVYCQIHTHAPLIRRKRKWYCPLCDDFFNDAHLQTIKDYFLLIDGKITNQQFRRFALIQSPDTSRRMLLSLKLDSSGSNKNRSYFPRSFPW